MVIDSPKIEKIGFDNKGKVGANICAVWSMSIDIIAINLSQLPFNILSFDSCSDCVCIFKPPSYYIPKIADAI